MTDNAQPTTEAGRRLPNIAATLHTYPMAERVAFLVSAAAAIEAEARIDSAAKVRALVDAIRQHTAGAGADLLVLSDAYFPNEAMAGRMAGAQNRLSRHIAAIDDALRTALDADAPAKTRVTEPPAEFYHGHDSYYEGCDECAMAYAYVRPEPRSAEPVTYCRTCGKTRMVEWLHRECAPEMSLHPYTCAHCTREWDSKHDYDAHDCTHEKCR